MNADNLPWYLAGDRLVIGKDGRTICECHTKRAAELIVHLANASQYQGPAAYTCSRGDRDPIGPK